MKFQTLELRSLLEDADDLLVRRQGQRCLALERRALVLGACSLEFRHVRGQ